MWAIIVKEVNAFLDSLIAYIVIGVFLTGVGLFVWVFPDTNVLDYGYASLETLFAFTPYVFMFLVPAITMRTFSEEQKGGTLELLLTRPLSDWHIVLGKFISSFLLVVVALLPTLLYYVALYNLGSPVGNIDSAGVAGSYIGLLLLGGVFTAIGLWASSLTANQLVAFILAVFLCFLIYTGFASLAAIDLWGTWSPVIEQLGILYHYESISRGLLDSRNLLYFLSVIAFMLMLTRFKLGSRQW